MKKAENCREIWGRTDCKSTRARGTDYKSVRNGRTDCKSARAVLTVLLMALMATGCSAKNPKQSAREVKASYIIEQLNKGRHIYLDSCIVWGDLDFTMLSNRNRIAGNLTQVFVNQSITFNRCLFTGKVKAFDAAKGISAEFAHNLSFTYCDFRSEVDFTESIIQGNAFFTGSIFCSTVKLQGAHFRHKKVYFNETKFEDEAYFQNVVFAGDVNFLHTVFSASALFQKAVSGGLMFFGDVRFNGYADFSYARAVESIFKEAQFNDRFDFECAVLNSEGLDARIANPREQTNPHKQ